MSSTAVNYHSPMLVLDPYVCKRIIDERQARGIDKYDEVWEGTYIMSPGPSNEHQRLVGKLWRILDDIVTPAGGLALPGVNVTDRKDDWEYNYRTPDIVVVLPGCKAKDIGVAWLGGPDFLVEVRSPYDKTLEKLEFYSRISVRELLVIDRETKELELFALCGAELQSQGQSTEENSITLTSGILPVSFQLHVGDEPQVLIRQTDSTSAEWLV
jgi:Uma2 family endonuclease